MIKTLEKSGRTEYDALNAALEELGMDIDDVSVEILTRAKSGFLGIGATQAVIRVSYECEDEPEKPAPAAAPEKKPAAEAKKSAPAKPVPAKETAPVKESKPAPQSAPAAPADKKAEEYADIRAFLSGLFERMGIEAEIEITQSEKNRIDVNLTGNGLGAIIGRRGETLDAIQHLTNYVINRGNDKRTHINIDAESYRSKREESLTHLAEKMAEKAIKYKRSMALEPMNSYERHVIHTALQNYKGVTTASTGEEPNRRVVVSYVKTEDDEAPAEKKPKTREWA